MAEKEFFNHGEVLVTQSRVVVGNSTYPVNSLSAVHLSQSIVLKASSEFWLWITISLVVFFISFILAVSSDLSFLIIGGLASTGLTFYANSLKEKVLSYHVVFHTSGTNIQAYTSSDKKEIEDIVKAINEAIIARG